MHLNENKPFMQLNWPYDRFQEIIGLSMLKTIAVNNFVITQHIPHEPITVIAQH